MAKKDSKSAVAEAYPETTEEVSVEGAALPVVKVEPQGEDASEAYIREQNEALYRYKVTGERGVYIDPTRDQEPDIAPELGVSPHPELANPRTPEGPFTGVNLRAEDNPVLQSVEDKDKAAEEVAKRADEAKDAAVESQEGDNQQADEDSPAEVNVGERPSPLVSHANVRSTD